MTITWTLLRSLWLWALRIQTTPRQLRTRRQGCWRVQGGGAAHRCCPTRRSRSPRYGSNPSRPKVPGSQRSMSCSRRPPTAKPVERLGVLRWWSRERGCPSSESNPMDNTTIMSWNVRGLNDRARRDAVRTLVDDIRPSIVCLQETKLDVISQYLVFAMLGMSFADFAYLPASNTRGSVLVAAKQADISLSDEHVGCYLITVRVHPCA